MPLCLCRSSVEAVLLVHFITGPDLIYMQVYALLLFIIKGFGRRFSR